MPLPKMPVDPPTLNYSQFCNHRVLFKRSSIMAYLFVSFIMLFKIAGVQNSSKKCDKSGKNVVYKCGSSSLPKKYI